jgi:COP9 signalosome complex subunit 3
MIFIARRDWPTAQEALYRVITHPCSGNATSKIMVEGFKKWILVSLIAEGKLPEVPTFVDKQALSSLNTVCRQYRNLDLLFTAPDPERLRSEWNRLASMWKEDRNEGLMREVMQAHQPWQIVNLRNIYSKISITEIRTQTKNAVTGEHLRTDADVESLVSSMIGSGMLAARLEKPANGPAHVVFVEDAEILSEAAFSARLAGTAKKVTQLNELYKAMNAKLSTHKAYVAHVQRERKRLEKESESQRDPFEATVMDEDLMGGLLDSQPS